MRLPRHIAPPADAEAMAARRFAIWRRPAGSSPVMSVRAREGTVRGGGA
jgi:hypothetical protein